MVCGRARGKDPETPVQVLMGAVFEFFDMLNRFYGVVQEFCTQRTCRTMSAGPGCVASELPSPCWLAG